MNEEVTSIAGARERKPRVTYSDDLLMSIFDRISNGESLNKICASDEMPSRKAFFEWVAKDQSIQAQYELAMSFRADTLFDEILTIADEGKNDTYVDEDGNVKTNQDVIARSRLRVDARKWMAGKLRPKVYGEKVQTELSGSVHMLKAAELADDELAHIAASGSK